MSSAPESPRADILGLAGASTRRPKDDVVIAVMGCTGTGKSSLVRLLTGDVSVEIGHKLQSETRDIKDYAFLDRNTGRLVTIVDTPGFDDSRAGFTDTEVLRKIADFLVKEYDQDRKLTGLIYLTRISDPRFGAQSSRNLRMFRSLCGSGTYKNVVVLTTFWDRVSEGEGSEREADLKENFFSDLVNGGARFMRYDCTIDSALQVLAHIFTLAPSIVRIQEEIRVEEKTLEYTEAGLVRRGEVERLIAKHQQEMTELKEELDAVKQSNAIAKQALELAQERLQCNLERWEHERSELKRAFDEEKKAREQGVTKMASEVEQLKRRLDEKEQSREWTKMAREREERKRVLDEKEKARKRKEAKIAREKEELKRAFDDNERARKRQDAQLARAKFEKEEKDASGPQDGTTPAEEESGWCLLQ